MEKTEGLDRDGKQHSISVIANQVRAATIQIRDRIKELRRVRAKDCLLYTSPSPRDLSTSRMPSSA